MLLSKFPISVRIRRQVSIASVCSRLSFYYRVLESCNTVLSLTVTSLLTFSNPIPYFFVRRFWIFRLPQNIYTTLNRCESIDSIYIPIYTRFFLRYAHPTTNQSKLGISELIIQISINQQSSLSSS